MNNKRNNSNSLAIKMALSLALGLIAGIGCIFLRESVGVDSSLWININNILFQDIIDTLQSLIISMLVRIQPAILVFKILLR